jgi:hypothetical protein
MAARAERTSASDLPDGARDIFGFHEFVKTETNPSLVIPGRREASSPESMTASGRCLGQ